MDRMLLYDLLFALAARDGRGEALFGGRALLAREAFAGSLAGEGFPELWLELPLAGEPWVDLHALWSRGQLGQGAEFGPCLTGGSPEVFRWFAAQGPSARQLALSWDAGSAGTGELPQPAVQLLRRTRDTRLVCDFLDVAGRTDAAGACRSFEERLPEGWFACYTGVFPQRAEPFLRVECIPTARQQGAYADDPALLAAHLRQVGLAELGDTLLPRCQALAATSFRLEFQFDVTPEGTAGSTFSASVRFAPPPGDATWAAFDANGAAGTLMGQVRDWGLADNRWRLLSGTSFSKRLERADESWRLWCFPVFLKLRWRVGEPVDAKAYLMAGAFKSQPEEQSC